MKELKELIKEIQTEGHTRKTDFIRGYEQGLIYAQQLFEKESKATGPMVFLALLGWLVAAVIGLLYGLA